jgi:flagellar basal-body rod modification protein FlgD
MRIGGIPDSLTQTSNPAANGAGGKDEFLTLFMAQLQNQDPLSPQDGAEFVAQLAQFSSLEQLAQLNDRLASLEAGQAASSRASLTDLVGRTVEAHADTLSLSQSGTPPLSVHLDGPAEKVTVSIFDANGTEVRKLELGATPSGDTALDLGSPLPPGQYRVEVKATAPGGGELSAFAKLKGILDALDFSGGTARFRMGGALLAPSEVLAVVAN